MKHILLAVLLFPAGISCTARDAIKDINGYMRVFQSASLHYNYAVQLLDEQNGRLEDQIQGRLYVSGKKYLDSSETVITLRNENYYCKIDVEDQSAIVFDLKLAEQKTGMTADSEPIVLMNLTDSIINHYGKISIDSSKKNSWVYTFSITGAAQKTYCKLTVNPVKNTLSSFEFAITEPKPTGEKYGYIRRCSLTNFSASSSQSIFDLTRFCSISNHKITLKGKYSKYKINAVI